MSVSGCHKVLIVDDERTIADTLAEIFSTRCGYETRAVYTAEEAMNMLAGCCSSKNERHRPCDFADSTVSGLPTVTVFRSAVHRRSPGGSHEKRI
jgi:CheY-like chemotaxis protein